MFAFKMVGFKFDALSYIFRWNQLKLLIRPVFHSNWTINLTSEDQSPVFDQWPFRDSKLETIQNSRDNNSRTFA